jgi:hypothetical protein
MTAVEVIDFLWRDGMAPQWIDVTVVGVEGGVTLIELLCCGQYVEEEEQMYYQPFGKGPFGVKGPALPPGWDDKRGEKFDLHWLREVRRKSPAGPSTV